MTQIPPPFHLNFQPEANPEAVVIAGSARFTILEPGNFSRSDWAVVNNLDTLSGQNNTWKKH